VAESLAPGDNISALARRHGLASSQIFRWRRMNGTPKRAMPPALSFAPVVVDDKPAAIVREVIEIEFKGAKLRIPVGTRPSTIMALLKAYSYDRLSRDD
jgi:transposase